MDYQSIAKQEESVWQQSIYALARPALPGNMTVDVAVIGGGLTGILTAYFLQQSGRECVVLEADSVGGGQTAHTTAKITSQHNLVYHKLCQAVGKERARHYAEANEKAIRRYEILIEKYSISCGLRKCDAYLYATGGGKSDRLLREECRVAKELGLPADLTTKTELPFEVSQALCFHNQACFHPLKFLYAMAEKVTVYEQTKVQRVVPMSREGGRLHANAVITNHGTVRANRVVFACHYPFVIRPGYYFLRMHQERSYVLGLKGTAYQGENRMKNVYLGIDKDALSFRGAGDVLLLGGGNHRTGENTGNQYEYLLGQADKYWPECKAVAKWSAQDCMTLDGIPYIGRFSGKFFENFHGKSNGQPGGRLHGDFGADADGWYVATGYGKWGMTSSMVAALLLTDLLNGRENAGEDVYSPRRKTIVASAKTFVTEGKYAAVNILKEKWGRTDERKKTGAHSTSSSFRGEVKAMHPGECKVFKKDGEKLGVYKDEKGEAYVVSVKCPHLGCLLSWNADEKSWDCPCHGSRFSYTGELLDGPAQTKNAATCALR